MNHSTQQVFGDAITIWCCSGSPGVHPLAGDVTNWPRAVRRSRLTVANTWDTHQTSPSNPRPLVRQEPPATAAVLMWPSRAGGLKELLREKGPARGYRASPYHPQQPQRSASAEGSFVVVVSNSLLQNISWPQPRAEALSAPPSPPQQTRSSCGGLSRLPVHRVYKLTPYRGCTRAD